MIKVPTKVLKKMNKMIILICFMSTTTGRGEGGIHHLNTFIPISKSMRVFVPLNC